MITALILAAGQSKRMGQPKMLLPWGEMTVLETVIATFGRRVSMIFLLLQAATGNESKRWSGIRRGRYSIQITLWVRC
jgi:CTP:molybdopterin cytidylyltransferase MocA